MQLGSLQYPHNPMKGASEHFHFLSVLAVRAGIKPAFVGPTFFSFE